MIYSEKHKEELIFLFLELAVRDSGNILAVPTAAIVKIVCSKIPSLHFVEELMSKA